MDHLVVVCGHGTYRGIGDPWQEASWVLESFRKSDSATNKPSEHTTFIQHILAGATIIEQDPKALLVFSGAKTQNEVETTEAESYAQVFDQLTREKKNMKTERRGRVCCEIYATDSYQNLLFSILRFRVVTGQYPHHISVITHAFKERRFLTLHAPAIRWPAEKIRTLGINPAFTLHELTRVQWGENESAVKHFINDPYATKSPLLDKKLQRGWKTSSIELLLTSIETDVTQLVLWNGGDSGNAIFAGPLPWS